MRKDLLDFLVCPDTGRGGLRLYAIEAEREGAKLRDLSDRDLRPGDDIVRGIIFDEAERRAYPVIDSVAVLLSDRDADKRSQTESLLSLRDGLPPLMKTMIDDSLARLSAGPETSGGRWNSDEMRHFDKDVASESLRAQFLEKIRRIPLWDIYLSRKKAITDRISFAAEKNAFLLEVGCGNSRTVSWIFPPDRRGYRYVGADISLKRLFLAKKVIPGGDFIQSSAQNLPFRPETFHAVLGFGVFHHLENPLAAVEHCARKVKPGGFLAFHEPIGRPKLLKKNSRLRPLFEGYIHSPHDNDIEGEAALSRLRNDGFEILYKTYEKSVGRYLAGRLLAKAPILDQRKGIHEFVIAMDQAVIRTLGRVSPLFGPSSILCLAKKHL